MDGFPSPSCFESISRRLYAPLLPPLGAIASGILFAYWLAVAPGVSAACAAMSLGLWVIARRLRLAWGCLVAGNAVVFWLATANAGWNLPREKPVIEMEMRELVSLRGCVDSLPLVEKDRITFLFAPEREARVRVSYSFKAGEGPPGWRYGDLLNLPLRLRPIRNAGNPGAFDAEGYFARRQIYWSGTIASGYPIELQSGACGNRWQGLVLAARTYLLRRVAELAQGDRYLESMLGALLLGENARLEEADVDAYRRTGTYHALVISGIHVSVLAGALFGALRLLPLTQQEARMITAGSMFFYAILCGLAAPVSRAACGYFLYALGKLFYRRGRPLNLLAAVAIALLAWDPGQLFEASFQLSFLAVFTLAGLVSPWVEHSTGLWRQSAEALWMAQSSRLSISARRRLLELELLAQTLRLVTGLPARAAARLVAGSTAALCWVGDMLATGGFLLVGLALPMALYFHRLSFASLTANLPVVALLSLTIPLGFLGLILGPVVTPVLRWLIEASRACVDWHLQWDLALRLPDPPGLFMLALAMSFCGMTYLAQRWSRWLPLACLVTLGLFAGLASSGHWREPDLAKGQLELTAVDVGQGDSLFLASPGGHLALVDGGGSFSARTDPGEKTVSPYLWSRGIARLDTLIASHGDLDHIGGLLALHENFRPRELWVSAQIRGPNWERLLELAQRAGTRVRYLAAGDCLALGEIEVETLWPPRDEVFAKTNLGSLVLQLRHGRHRFLLTGDIEASVEERLLENPALGRVDVLKVAHHGSRTSSSSEFLAWTQPAISLASLGFANSFRHPHPSVVARFAAMRSLLLRTDQDGAIRVLSDGWRLRVEPYRLWRPQAGAFIPLLPALE